MKNSQRALLNRLINNPSDEAVIKALQLTTGKARYELAEKIITSLPEHKKAVQEVISCLLNWDRDASDSQLRKAACDFDLAYGRAGIVKQWVESIEREGRALLQARDGHCHWLVEPASQDDKFQDDSDKKWQVTTYVRTGGGPVVRMRFVDLQSAFIHPLHAGIPDDAIQIPAEQICNCLKHLCRPLERKPVASIARSKSSHQPG